jgi:hypothetical protein
MTRMGFWHTGPAVDLLRGKLMSSVGRRCATCGPRRRSTAASCPGCALRLIAVKRSPGRTSVPQKHDILTHRPLRGVGSRSARWRSSGRRVMPRAQVAEDLLHQARIANNRDDALRVLADRRRSGPTCQARRMRCHHRFNKSLAGGGGETTERWNRHAGRSGFPHEINLRRGGGLGLVDEVAECALPGQSFGGKAAGRGRWCGRIRCATYEGPGRINVNSEHPPLT